MPETHDIGNRFVQFFRYPEGSSPPISESGIEVHEIDEPYRIGSGVIFRVLGTRRAIVFGKWTDEGGEEHERLVAALKSRNLEVGTDDIRGWVDDGDT